MTSSTPLQRDARWAELLTEIYGNEGAASVVDRYTTLILEHRRGSPRRRDHLSTTDSWLIAYPDHLSEAGRSTLQSLDAFIEQRLKPNVSGVHILPCFPSSSDEGFSVMDYTEIDPRYGTWADIEQLARHTDVMLDAVINHASVHGRWFTAWRSGDPRFADFFRTEDPDADLSAVVRARQHPLLTKFDTAMGERWVWTTFSEDQADLDYRNPEVMLAIARVLLTYALHGASAIRLDAVGFLWKEAGTSCIHLDKTHKIVQLIRATLDATYPDVLVVTETNVPHTENVAYLGDGSVREADMVYQFPLPPLVIHAFTTGDARALKRWLTTIDDIPKHTTYFNFLSSHDGVGLRPLEGLVASEEVNAVVDACVANGNHVTYRSGNGGSPVPYELNGTWYDLIRGGSSGDEAMHRHVASHSIMFALRGEPAVYVQALLAESNAQDLAESTSQVRSVNRRRFTIDAVNTCLDNPTSPAAISLEALLAMLSWRHENSAFVPLARQRVLETPDTVIGIERVSPSGDLARVYVNVSPDNVAITLLDHHTVSGFNVVATDDGIELAPYGTAWVTINPDSATGAQ